MHLEVVNHRAGGDIRKRQGVTGLDLGLRSRRDNVADLETDRPEDVALFAVHVLDERDPRRAVWIVLHRHDAAGNAEFIAPEIYRPQAALGAAAPVADGNAALVIAAAAASPR